MRGIGEPHRQIGEDGLAVSGAPVALPMVIGPIEIGNRHSQHTSVMGFTNRPVQTCADALPAPSTANEANASERMKRHLMPARRPGPDPRLRAARLRPAPPLYSYPEPCPRPCLPAGVPRAR